MTCLPGVNKPLAHILLIFMCVQGVVWFCAHQELWIFPCFLMCSGPYNTLQCMQGIVWFCAHQKLWIFPYFLMCSGPYNTLQCIQGHIIYLAMYSGYCLVLCRSGNLDLSMFLDVFRALQYLPLYMVITSLITIYKEFLKQILLSCALCSKE